MSKLPKNAWDLFQLLFEEGDDVIALDDEERLYVGPLQSDPEGATLRLVGAVRASHVPWERIVFLADSGFPARKLCGADGSATVAALDNTPHVKYLRNLERERRRDARLGICDPWLIEGVGLEIVNPGNNTWADFDNEQDECLVMTARDGARACLWDIEQVFHLEEVTP